MSRSNTRPPKPTAAELDLLRAWTGWRAGVDVPAVYVEHNTPAGPAACPVVGTL